MSLKLASKDNSDLNTMLEQINRNGKTSVSEFRRLRDVADRQVAVATGIDVHSGGFLLGAPVVQFLYLADAVVNTLKDIGTGVAQKQLSAQHADALHKALEFQIAYVVAGYQHFIAQGKEAA